MRIASYIYDSADADDHIDLVLDLLEPHEEVELLDIALAKDREAARREAMLTVKSAVRVGTAPAELFDENGQPDFSAGALIAEKSTGRRSLHVGKEALTILRDEG